MELTSLPVLSASEQRLLLLLPPRTSISLEDAATAFGPRFNRKYLSELLSRLSEKGRIARLKNGVYYAEQTPSLASVWRAVSMRYPGAYAAFSTALYLHGVADQRPSTLFFATETSYCKLRMWEFDVRLVAFNQDFYGTQELNGVRASTLPKTLYDCLCRPKWSGGFIKAVALLEKARLTKAQYGELANFFGQSKNVRAAKRLLREAPEKLPKAFARELKKIAGEKV